MAHHVKAYHGGTAEDIARASRRADLPRKKAQRAKSQKATVDEESKAFVEKSAKNEANEQQLAGQTLVDQKLAEQNLSEQKLSEQKLSEQILGPSIEPPFEPLQEDLSPKGFSDNFLNTPWDIDAFDMFQIPPLLSAEDNIISFLVQNDDPSFDADLISLASQGTGQGDSFLC